MHHLAENNVLTRLRQNDYPGRGMIIGLNKSGTAYFQIYWIMGRSETSRHRFFEIEGEILRTAPLGPKPVTGSELIIYNALRHFESQHVVTNGDQTDTLIQAFQAQLSFETALQKRTYEPDAPNFTPRIAGVLNLTAQLYLCQFALIKKSPFDNSPMHQFFNYSNLPAGFGLCLHTYQQNGNPLPAFIGEPYWVPMGESGELTAAEYWQALNCENRVALALKSISKTSGAIQFYLINRYRNN